MYSTYETELRVRPDDIDMYNHVHHSKYMDYVMAARYDQMERFYGMGMEKFLERGYGWLVRSVYMDYKRALKMNDYFLVRTGIKTIDEKKCKVHFEILNKLSVWVDIYLDQTVSFLYRRHTKPLFLYSR